MACSSAAASDSSFACFRAAVRKNHMWTSCHLSTQPGHKGQRCCPLGSAQCSLASAAGSNNRLSLLVPLRRQVKHLAASLTRCQWLGVRPHFKDGLLSQPRPHLPSCSEPTLPPIPSLPMPHPTYQKVLALRKDESRL